MRQARDLIFGYFNTLGNVDKVSLKNRTLLFTMGIMAFLVQLVMVFVYAILKCPPMVVCAAIGTLAAAVCCLMVMRKHYNLAGLLMTGGIVLVAVADDYFVGSSNNSMLYLFTVLVITLQIPYKPRFILVVLCILLPLLMAGLYVFGFYHMPLYPLGNLMRVFAVINILTTAGSAILIHWLSRTISSFADAYSERRIEELETQSYRDALTKMYNRHYADRYFEEMKREATDTIRCIAIADIDDFKKVNDTYGHDAGDTTLREIARLMRKNVRQRDLIIRWGGEEFVIILQDVSPETAHGILDKLRMQVEKHIITHNAYRFQVTATFGLSELSVSDIPGSLNACDEKLYNGKRSTKNVVVV